MQNRSIYKAQTARKEENSNLTFSQESAHKSPYSSDDNSHYSVSQSSARAEKAPRASYHQPQARSVQKDDLTRIFNTAIVSTQAKEKREFSTELYELTESASFKAILNAVRQLSRVQGISERQASEQIIHTFRKMDDIWGSYVSQEGLEKLRGSRS